MTGAQFTLGSLEAFCNQGTCASLCGARLALSLFLAYQGGPALSESLGSVPGFIAAGSQGEQPGTPATELRIQAESQQALARLVAQDGATLYHGTSAESAQGLLRNPALDAGQAATNCMDGPGGFHLATDAGDAEYFALRRSPGAILQYDITGSGMEGLLGAGATLRDIPGNPPPYFTGQEFHIPVTAFETFNALLEAGEIQVAPYGP